MIIIIIDTLHVDWHLLAMHVHRQCSFKLLLFNFILICCLFVVCCLYVDWQVLSNFSINWNFSQTWLSWIITYSSFEDPEARKTKDAIELFSRLGNKFNISHVAHVSSFSFRKHNWCSTVLIKLYFKGWQYRRWIIWRLLWRTSKLLKTAFGLQTTCTLVAAREVTKNTSVKVHPNTTHGSSLTLSMPKMRKRQLEGPPP